MRMGSRMHSAHGTAAIGGHGLMHGRVGWWLHPLACCWRMGGYAGLPQPNIFSGLYSCVRDPPPRGWWWMGAQSLVGAEEMRHLQSYLGPLDRLVVLTCRDYRDWGPTSNTQLLLSFTLHESKRNTLRTALLRDLETNAPTVVLRELKNNSIGLLRDARWSGTRIGKANSFSVVRIYVWQGRKQLLLQYPPFGSGAHCNNYVTTTTSVILASTN
jgi:hypothetical protein